MKKIHKVGWTLTLVLIIILVYFIFFYPATLGNYFCDSYCKGKYSNKTSIGKCYTGIANTSSIYGKEPTLVCGLQHYCLCSWMIWLT